MKVGCPRLGDRGRAFQAKYGYRLGNIDIAENKVAVAAKQRSVDLLERTNRMKNKGKGFLDCFGWLDWLGWLA